MMRFYTLIYICSTASLLASTEIISKTSDKLYPVPLNTGALPAEMRDSVVAQFIDGNGKLINVHTTLPATPPIIQAATLILPPSAVMISGVPAFKWTYGCSPTAVGMLCGFWDRSGFPNIYTGNINDGVCPLNNSSWGGSSECSFIASKKGVDGRTTKGHVDDYWYAPNSTRDPYYSKWTPHSQPGTGDCLADFMATSQYYNHTYPNTDGNTLWGYEYYGNPRVMNGYGFGSYGVRLFIESRGYQIARYFNQYIYGMWGNTEGFTFQDYMGEIDAGRPVILGLNGHTIIGIGYNASTSKVYLHDGWDYNVHEMTWGGTYNGLQHYGVSVFEMAALTPPPENDSFASALPLEELSGGTSSSNLNASCESEEPAHYTAAHASLWWKWTAPKSGEVTFNTYGSNFDTTMAAYSGTSLLSLTQLDNNNDSNGSLQSAVSFPVTAGESYYIAVDGYNAAAGSIALHWELEYLEVFSSSIVEDSGAKALRLNFSVRSGASYAIKRKDSLSASAPWYDLSPPLTFMATATGPYQVDIEIPAEGGSAFFKIIRQ